MNVAELIEALKALPQDLPVTVCDQEGYCAIIGTVCLSAYVKDKEHRYEPCVLVCEG